MGHKLFEQCARYAVQALDLNPPLPIHYYELPNLSKLLRSILLFVSIPLRILAACTDVPYDLQTVPDFIEMVFNLNRSQAFTPKWGPSAM